jgi:hypothetical protein
MSTFARSLRSLRSLRSVLITLFLGVIPALAQEFVPGSTNIATSQVTVGATATLIIAAHPGRANLAIINQGSATICLGNSTVTLTTGICLPPGNNSYVGIVLPYTGALYGITASSDVISAVELF